MNTTTRPLATILQVSFFIGPLLLPAPVRAVPPQKPTAGRLSALAFVPDGRTLVAANTSGVVQLWNTRKGAAAGNLADLQTLICLAVSPDGKTLATTSWEGGATLWDLPSASIRAVLKGHTDVIESVAFAADGQRLATASWDGTVKLWDVESGRCMQSIQGPGTQRAVACSADGKTLAVGTSDSLRILELPMAKEIFTIEHTNDIRSLDFSPDGKTLLVSYSGTKGCTVGVLDIATKRELLSVKAHKSRASCVKFSPDGKLFATAGDSPTIQIWDAQTGQQRLALDGHTRSTFAVAFSPDSTTLASSGADGNARLWDVASGQELAVLKAQTSVAVSPASVKLWRLGAGSDRATLLDLGVMAGVALSPDGKTLASGSWEGTVTLWDMHSGRERTTFKAHDEVAFTVAFSPDSQQLATGGWDDTVKVWVVESRKELIALKGKTGRIYCVTFAPDGKVVASGTRDRMAKLWDVDTGRELASLPHAMHVFGVAFAPFDVGFATAAHRHPKTPNTVRIWDPVSGQERLAINGHADGSALFVGFSWDGKCLASAGDDGTVKLWEAATGKRLAVFDSDTASILSRVGPNVTAALPALASALGDADLGVCRRRTEKLWPNKMDKNVVISCLIEALRHEHAVIRAGAADALAQLGPAAKAAVPLLVEVTRDQSQFARAAAAAALQKIDTNVTKPAGVR